MKTLQERIPARPEIDDGRIVRVAFNNGVSKPMCHARKRCLDDAHKWEISLRRPPTEEEWRDNPQMFTLGIIDELFGSYEEMLCQLAAAKIPLRRQSRLYHIQAVLQMA